MLFLIFLKTKYYKRLPRERKPVIKNHQFYYRYAPGRGQFRNGTLQIGEISDMQNQQTDCYDYHVMTCHDTSHESDKSLFTCHDSDQVTDQVSDQVKNRIGKNEWLFLVETLDKWHVFNPRAIVKKNPAAAWKCMNLCKDKGVRVPGAYFTACFRTELARAEFKRELQKRMGVA